MQQQTTLIMSLVLALSVFAAPGSAQDGASDAGTVSKEARDLLDALGQYSAEQRDEAMEATREAMDAVDESIDSLEHKTREQWDSMDAAARESARETMRTLREERTELAEWYGAMEKSSDSAWDEMKAGFADAYESLGDAWQNANAEFENDE